VTANDRSSPSVMARMWHAVGLRRYVVVKVLLAADKVSICLRFHVRVHRSDAVPRSHWRVCRADADGVEMVWRDSDLCRFFAVGAMRFADDRTTCADRWQLGRLRLLCRCAAGRQVSGGRRWPVSDRSPLGSPLDWA